MLGHLEPVRCLEISGMKVVSGSYDNTARVSSPVCVALTNANVKTSHSFGTSRPASAYSPFRDITTKSMPLPLMDNAS